jgi:hypothetical protein
MTRSPHPIRKVEINHGPMNQTSIPTAAAICTGT